MDQPFRLKTGGRIDRSQPVRFVFNGRGYTGYRGDTLASALVANGVDLVGRSLKLHRPRGLLAAGAEDPNALVEVGSPPRILPNARATMVDLHQGLEAETIKGWPGLGVDLLAGLDLVRPLLPAGVYLAGGLGRPVLWERGIEPIIRRLAGFGRAPRLPDPDLYVHRHLTCDVAVIGAGPAGLTAARAAARGGARVVLIDEQAEPGGSLWGQTRRFDGVRDTADWVAAAVADLAAGAEVRRLPRTTVLGLWDSSWLLAVERLTHHRLDHGGHGPRDRLWQIRARRVILATGAIERPLVFPGNDRPGVMLAQSAATYALRYAALPGRRAVVFAADTSAYAAAFALQSKGVEIAALVDARPEAVIPTDDPHVAMAAALRIPVRPGWGVTATWGRPRLARVQIAPLAIDAAGIGRVADRPTARRGETIAADLLCVCGGWSPDFALARQMGWPAVWDSERRGFVPAPAGTGDSDGGPAPAPRVGDRAALEAGTGPLRIIGSAAGTHTLAALLDESWAAGLAAAADVGCPARDPAAPDASGPADPLTRPLDREGTDGIALWQVQGVGPGLPPAFVDIQNDTTDRDIARVVHLGLTGIESARRYTLTGFGTDQGRTSVVNAIGLLGALTGRDPGAVGLTTARAPTGPVSFGALAGRMVGPMLAPVRESPLHDLLTARGGVAEDLPQGWKRMRAFPHPGEPIARAIDREARAARHSGVMTDLSAVGKLAVSGPDAAAFLDRVLASPVRSLAVGEAGPALVCRSDGTLQDLGRVWRLEPTRFLVITTPGSGPGLWRDLEQVRQTTQPRPAVHLVDVSDHHALIALAGPAVTAVLAPLEIAPISDRAPSPPAGGDIAPGADPLSATDWPVLAVRAHDLAGIGALLLRLPFSGRGLAAEVLVRRSRAPALWQALAEAGQALGLLPCGGAAWDLIQAEDGAVLPDRELDAGITPRDLGLGALVKRDGDWRGRQGGQRRAFLDPHRRRRVGLRPDDPTRMLEDGAAVLDRPFQASTTRDRAGKPDDRPDETAGPIGAGAIVGHVTYAARSPAMGGPVARALVGGGPALTRLGTRLWVTREDGGDPVPVTVIDPGFHGADAADPEAFRIAEAAADPVAPAIPAGGHSDPPRSATAPAATRGSGPGRGQGGGDGAPSPLLLPAPVPPFDPLDSWADRLRHAGTEAVALAPMPPHAGLTLQGNRDARPAGLVALVGGASLPGPGRLVDRRAHEGGLVLSIGPEAWLALAPVGSEEATALAGLRQAAGAEAAEAEGTEGAVAFLTVTETDDAWVGLDILNRQSEPAAPAVLARGCSLDLHPRAFPPGSCAVTRLAGERVVIAALGPLPGAAATDHGRIRVLVRPSVARFMAWWLVDVLAELRCCARG